MTNHATQGGRLGSIALRENGGLLLATADIDKTPKGLTPEQQIRALQVQLEQANEKARLFEAMLEVLKKDYGARIVKKPLGKPSSRG